MVSWLELGSLLMPAGSFFGTNFVLSRCIPRELPWCTPLETLNGISLCLLGIGAPWDFSSWAQKILIVHQRVKFSSRLQRLKQSYIVT